MINTNNSANNLSYAKPIELLLCLIQMKMLASPSTTSFQSNIVMILAVASPRNNKKPQIIENQQAQQSRFFYEINDDAINANNVSKDTCYHAPIQKILNILHLQIHTQQHRRYQIIQNQFNVN